MSGLNDVVEQATQFVTLADLCGEVPERDHKVKVLPRYGKSIKYRARVPLDRLLKLNRKYKMSSENKADREGYYAELLMGLLIDPRVPDIQTAKALLKGDGGLLMQIVGEATGAVETEEEGEEIKDEVGELSAYGSTEV